MVSDNKASRKIWTGRTALAPFLNLWLHTTISIQHLALKFQSKHEQHHLLVQNHSNTTFSAIPLAFKIANGY